MKNKIQSVKLIQARSVDNFATANILFMRENGSKIYFLPTLSRFNLLMKVLPKSPNDTYSITTFHFITKRNINEN